MFRRGVSRLCATAGPASATAHAATPPQAPPLRRHRWLRRLGWTAGVLGGVCVVTDVATDHSLTRSARTITTFLQLAYMYKFTTPSTPEEYSELNRRAGEKILYVCLKNEGLYIKLGQGLNSMSHMLPPEYTQALRVLLDRAPPVPMPLVEKTILQATGATALSDIFVDFDETPVASASIAQVHRAWVRNDALNAATPAARAADGAVKAPPVPTQSSGVRDVREGATMVAVKVRKPSIEKQAVWDVRTYQLISYLMERWFGLPTGWVRHTVVDALYREMDFTIEEQNAVTTRRLFAERSRLPVYVPYVYSSWTAPSLLVMEWVEGTKIVNVDEVRREYADPSAVIKTVFDAFGDMVFRDGFVHCDPHGANVLVRPRQKQKCTADQPATGAPAAAAAADLAAGPRRSGKIKDFEVVFIDFGMCVPLTEKFQMEYALFLKSIFSADMKLLQEVVTGWGIGNSEIFASMQMQKPLSSMHKGEYGEITKEEVARMQRMAHTKIKNFLSDEEKMPKELPMVVRGFDIIRGINRLYGSPVNRLNMMMQGAMNCLGPLHDYAGVERYLDRINARREAKTAAEAGGATTTTTTRIRSVYDADATRLREEQAAAAKELADSQTWLEHFTDFWGSMMRLFMFRLVLLHVQLLHSGTYWYNRLLDALGLSSELHLRTLDDRVEEVAQSF